MNNKFTIIIIVILFTQNICAQVIKFKDENLKSALLELGYDFNKDKEIQISEIDTVNNLSISKRNIVNLDDLVYFKSLKIVNAMKNQITNLDVFFNNSVIEEIYIGENKLGKKLTLKNIQNLKGLYAFRNGLEELSLISTNNIGNLYLQGNLFEKISVENLLKLKTLQLSENVNLKEVNVRKNVELIQLYLNNTNVFQIDISNNTLLKTLYIEKDVELIKSDKQNDFKPMQMIKALN